MSCSSEHIFEVLQHFNAIYQWSKSSDSELATVVHFDPCDCLWFEALNLRATDYLNVRWSS